MTMSRPTPQTINNLTPFYPFLATADRPERRRLASPLELQYCIVNCSGCFVTACLLSAFGSLPKRGLFGSARKARLPATSESRSTIDTL